MEKIRYLTISKAKSREAEMSRFPAFLLNLFEIRGFTEKTLTMKFYTDKIKLVYLTFFYLKNGNVALFVS